MGRKLKNKKKKSQGGVSGNKKVNSEKILKNDVKKHITAVILLLFALVFSLSLFGQAGIVGKGVDKVLTTLFGVGKYVLPVLLVSLGVMYFKKMQVVRYYLATGGMLLFFLAGVGLTHSFYDVGNMAKIAKEGIGGGYVGFAVAYTLIKLLGKFAGVASLFSLALIGFMLLFNAPVFNWFHKLKDIFERDDYEEESGGMEEHSGKVLTSRGYNNSGDIREENRISTERDKKNKNVDDKDIEKVGFFKKMFKSRHACVNGLIAKFFFYP